MMLLVQDAVAMLRCVATKISFASTVLSRSWRRFQWTSYVEHMCVPLSVKSLETALSTSFAFTVQGTVVKPNGQAS